MCDGTDMVLKIAQVGTRFEVVAAPIRNYAGVDDVDLSDAPTVETGFMEKVVENVVGAYLDVSSAGAKPANAEFAPYRAGIGRMGEPQDGGGVVSIEPRNDPRVQPLEDGGVIVRDRDRLSKRSLNRGIVIVDANV